MKIEKYVSPFVPQQFPAFYKEDGPNFIAFVKAYYEWMEQAGQALYYSRRHLENIDVDDTEATFLKYFRDNYISGIPEYALADKRLLVKHVLDLYRSKGTPRACELLFRLIFNESIDTFIPGNYLFKPSDGKWRVPKYIETTDCDYLPQLIGKGIHNASKTTTAVVDNYTVKNVGGKLINVLYLSAINGEFKYGDKIYSDVLLDSSNNELITDSNSPTVIGSLSAIAVTNGGYGFNTGDLLDVYGSGTDGKARVVATRTENGKVQFNLINGGSGYTMDAAITVATALDLILSNTVGVISFGDNLVDSTTNANGTVTFANTTFAQLINFSSNLYFTVGDTITTSGGASATVSSVLGGGGSGASFKIGGLVNKEIYQVEQNYISTYVNVPIDGSYVINISSTANTFTTGNTVTSSGNTLFLEGSYLTGNTITVGEQLSNSSLSISGLYAYISDGQQVWVYGSDANLTNANLVPGVVLVSNSTSSQYQLIDVSPKLTISMTGTVTAYTATSISVSNATSNVIPGSTVTDTASGATANVTAMTRTVDWGFPANLPNITNLDTKMNLALVFKTMEVGTISYLSSINPGFGYTANPFVSVVEPSILALAIDDGAGGTKGNNAIVTTQVLNSNGIVSAVEVVASGFGYYPTETVTMTSQTSNGVSVTGSTIVDTTGKGLGSWKDRSGFLDDIIKIQDSYYYQNYSYEVVAERMLSTYSSLVKDLIHPSGMALFGRFRLQRFMVSDQSTPMQFSVTQS